MHKLPFIERDHGPVGDAVGSLDYQARVTVGPFVAHLVRTHAVFQGVAATVRIARAQSLRAERGEPDLIHATTADALLALAEASSDMLAEQAERFAEWIEVAALADPAEARPASVEGKEATDG
ncbi:hypothetical protein [Paraburkholderia sp. CI3]|uniref:hypothetical protein n=1 Tax=Paraburkholderia sp. CI3 TaxID=2991060 RepID=UPI003D23B52B